ncbi:hypothetical protein C8F01DRAFT_1228828 [Mycena amicta]|nr:hypothetical protein C8F01DRAFT_1228828 [Mycena amicta]
MPRAVLRLPASGIHTEGQELASMMPPNILSDIFERLAPTYQTLGLNWCPKEGNAQLETLAHGHLLRVAGVCRTWRHAALGAPWLWTTIEVDFTDNGATPTVSTLLQLCIDRSVSFPLTIHARIPDRPLPATGRLRADLEKLMAASGRWSVVNISLARRTKTQPTFQSWLFPLDGPLPVLQRIHLQPRERFPVDLTKSPQLIQVLTTLLHEERTRNPNPLHKIPYWVPTLEAIYLSRDGIWPSGLFVALHRLTTSVAPLHLAVKFNTLPRGQWYPLSNGGMALVELHLTVWNKPEKLEECSALLNRVLSKLFLPRLRTLSIATPWSTRRPLCISPTAFGEFIERNSLLGQELTSLTLLNVVMFEYDLPPNGLLDIPTNTTTPKYDPLAMAEKWMRAVPCLTHLTLSDVLIELFEPCREPDAFHTVFTDELFEQLTLHPLLPRLVDLTCYTTLKFNPPVLRNVLSVRPRLQVHLKAYSEAGPSADEWPARWPEVVGGFIVGARVDFETVKSFEERSSRSQWAKFW